MSPKSSATATSGQLQMYPPHCLYLGSIPHGPQLTRSQVSNSSLGVWATQGPFLTPPGYLCSGVLKPCPLQSNPHTILRQGHCTPEKPGSPDSQREAEHTSARGRGRPWRTRTVRLWGAGLSAPLMGGFLRSQMPPGCVLG